MGRDKANGSKSCAVKGICCGPTSLKGIKEVGKSVPIHFGKCTRDVLVFVIEHFPAGNEGAIGFLYV